MKITEEMGARLRELAFAGSSNAEIAAEIGIPITDVYAYRSRNKITIGMVRRAKGGGQLMVNPEFEAALPHTCADCRNPVCPAKGKLKHLVECGAYQSPESRRQEYQNLWTRDFLRAMADRQYGLSEGKLAELRGVLEEIVPEECP